MAWFRVQLTAAEQVVVREEREHHPNLHIRRRMLALWLLHCGLTREKASQILGVDRVTVQRWVAAYRKGGLAGLRHWELHGPQSELASYRELILESLQKAPVRTVAQARERIKTLTGQDRGLTQTRIFLQGMGLTWQRVRAIPVPPKKRSTNTCKTRRLFMTPS